MSKHMMTMFVCLYTGSFYFYAKNNTEWFVLFTCNARYYEIAFMSCSWCVCAKMVFEDNALSKERLAIKVRMRRNSSHLNAADSQEARKWQPGWYCGASLNVRELEACHFSGAP